MKVNVRLPMGYGRAYNGSKGFVKASPTFEIEAFDDMGNRITDPYPSKVKFGPEMYNLLKKILPGIAASHNEDLHYNGDVEVQKQGRLKQPQKYAYYGLGRNPLTNTENNGVGLIGYGDTETPAKESGTPISGFLYSMLNKEEPVRTPKGSISRSAVLTNILNDSQDFSPLFAPIYDYTDLSYDPRLKTDRQLVKEELARRKGGNISDFLNTPQAITSDEINDFISKYNPRITDNFVPRIDPNTGGPMKRPDGRRVFVPIPLVQDMPIYNFNHPMWEKDPEAAWDLVNEQTKDYWEHWGTSPRYADYTGLTAIDDNYNSKMRDYFETNAKLAGRPGYFEYAPDAKNRGREAFRDSKHNKHADRYVAARKQKAESEQMERDSDRLRKSQEAFAKNHIASEGSDRKDKYKNSLERGQFYNAVVHHIFDEGSDSASIAKDLGVTPDDEKAMKRFAKDNMMKYNQIDSDDVKRLIILKDFVKSKSEGNTQSNIINGVKEPWQ